MSQFATSGVSKAMNEPSKGISIPSIFLPEGFSQRCHLQVATHSNTGTTQQLHAPQIHSLSINLMAKPRDFKHDTI